MDGQELRKNIIGAHGVNAHGVNAHGVMCAVAQEPGAMLSTLLHAPSCSWPACELSANRLLGGHVTTVSSPISKAAHCSA
eukprot:350208-Chlamydomonas_euryale.AAC.19